MSVSSLRISPVNDKPPRPDGDYVLYWMIAFRRAAWNFSLQRAAEWAKELGKPLVVLEALRSEYRWASDRLHRFVLDGMADNADRFRNRVLYYPYVEPQRGAGKGLLAALAKRAAVVVTDEFPCFFLPRMVAAAGERLPVLLEQVDSNGLLPLRATAEIFTTAHSFRRFLQKTLEPHLREFPKRNPLARLKLPSLKSLPGEIAKRWPPASDKLLKGDRAELQKIPIDHSVAVAPIRGGQDAGAERLAEFIEKKLDRYEARNEPEQDVASGLSPYLHFGHVSAHHVFSEVMAAEDWSADDLSDKATGSRSGWWGVREPVESFLDELVTWREVGYNMCHLRDDYDRYESLPDWARQTLEQHAGDEREHVYRLGEFERAETRDELWNAAQRQLLREGRVHNYLRMLWGKKILEWTATPRDALDVMIELNNKYALDGRDPNSYSGIFWVLGRYDRPWGPERPVFGKVRYMTSANTARKFKVDGYIERYS